MLKSALMGVIPHRLSSSICTVPPGLTHPPADDISGGLLCIMFIILSALKATRQASRGLTAVFQCPDVIGLALCRFVTIRWHSIRFQVVLSRYYVYY